MCRSAHNYFLFWIHFFVWNDLMMYLCQYFLIWTCHLAQNLQIECGILKIFLFKMMRKYMKWKYSNFVFFLAYCSCVSQIGYKILKIFVVFILVRIYNHLANYCSKPWSSWLAMPFLLKEKISCLSTDFREADQALCCVLLLIVTGTGVLVQKAITIYIMISIKFGSHLQSV